MPEQSPYAPAREVGRIAVAGVRRVQAPPHPPGSTSSLARIASGSLLAVAVLCLVVLFLSTRGITSEGTVSLQGDMPRYLMNGVYFFDLLRDRPITHLVEYTYRYFARYPALSLGHHPLLPGVAEVPFYAVFGVSIFSARLAILCFMLVGVLVWFRLIGRIYDRQVAFMSALLLATTPFVVEYSRVVMSEIPALAMLIVASSCFYQYCETLRRRDALLFAVAAAASVYGKHHCVLLFPIFIGYLALRRGPSSLFSRDMLLTAGLTGLLLAPLVPLTLEFARINVSWVQHASQTARVADANVLYYLDVLWRQHVTLPVLILSAVSFTISVLRHDRRVLLFFLWIVGFYLEITYLGVHDPRLAIYWIPPFCLLAASCLAHVRSPGWTAAVLGGLVLLVAYQFAWAARSEPEYADGYEEAACYVLDHRKGESVLFSGSVDSGFFVFFVRKHDPQERLIVLRADKTLVTSSLKRIVAERVTTRDGIYQFLRQFGTDYVVIEDQQFESPALELLRQELKTSNFALRRRIPIRSSSDKLRGVALAIYEYLGYTPADPDAVLNMRIPLMGGNVKVRFGDLLPNKGGGAPEP